MLSAQASARRSLGTGPVVVAEGKGVEGRIEAVDLGQVVLEHLRRADLAGGDEVVEGQGAARITVTRSGGTAGTMSVRFKTSDITARAPDDYTAAFAVVSFGAGDSGPKELMVPITDDSLPEGDETAQLVLEDPLEEAAIGDPRFAILKIRDNDRPGTLRFQTDRFEVAEGQPRAAVVVTVSRVMASRVERWFCDSVYSAAASARACR